MIENYNRNDRKLQQFMKCTEAGKVREKITEQWEDF